ncbi:MFS transporter [Rhizobium sp. IMFF44]|uniref:MFS transporter n=1 Tax=Rhizobium sp. IMFF44 TaxID=3342350 RepID=UPI0035BAA7AF
MSAFPASTSSGSKSVALAQLALAIGGLILGTGEFTAMGLLPDIANAVSVSVPEAGNFISAYALGVVIGSPLLAVATARMDRRKLLMLITITMFASNTATALASQYWSVSLARFFAGLPHGAYYGIASIVAASIVPRELRAQSIGRVMLGLAAANFIGVPIATALGQFFGWRATFIAVSAGSALVTLLIWVMVPSVEADPETSPGRELAGLMRLQVWLTLWTAAIGFGGMFAVYSYITHAITELARQPDSYVPAYLAFWGLGMVLGSQIGSWFIDKWQSGTIVVLLIWNITFLGLFAFTASSPIASATTLFFIGIGFGLVPALQARLMDVAPKAQSLAAAMNHSAFNLSNAIGAWTGGLAIAAGYGWASTGLVGAGLALLGLLVFVAALIFENLCNHS